MTTDHGVLSGVDHGDDTTSALVTPAALSHLVRQARELARCAKSDTSRRAYRSDWAAFVRWSDSMGVPSLVAAPDSVASYITALSASGKKVATISRALVSISQAHKMAGQESPTTSAVVRETMKGIRRTLGVAQNRKLPLLPEQIKAILDVSPDSILGMRDAALLLLGFAGGFRRSSLVNLDVADVAFTADGLVVTQRRGKTDQEGVGTLVGIPFGSTPQTCPVRALRRWLDAAAISEGPIFRPVGRWGRVGSERLGNRAVASVVQRYVAAIGLNPSLYAGHSLRAGLATAAARAGKSERAIMNQTGHRSVAIMRRYIREGSLFADNAAAGLL